MAIFLGEYPLAGRFNTVDDEDDPEENEALLEGQYKEAKLVPLTNNAYDRYAVSVQVDGEHAGFIPKNSNMPIFYLLDEGYRIVARFVLGEEKRGNLGIWTKLYMHTEG